MILDRREFLKNSAIMAGGVALAGCASIENKGCDNRANMCGWTNKPMDKVRVAFVGLGMRGPGAVDRISKIQDVEIVALCDIYDNKVKRTQNILTKMGRPVAKEFSGDKDAWKKMVQTVDFDLLYICTPWEMHVPMAVFGMKNGKHVAVEVTVATTMDECWEMVDTSEKYQKHCVILENCCYDFFELLTLNMTRKGLFGELTHGEGAYIHELGSWMMPNGGHNKSAYQDNWRYFHNTKSAQPNKLKDGNPYPTHGLGPIAQCMNVNRGNKIDYMTSMSSQEAAFTQMSKDLDRKDFQNKKDDYRGDMNTSLLKCANGETIMIQHDVSTPRPYSRIHLLQGSKGIAQKWPSPSKIALKQFHGGHDWLNKDEYAKISAEYEHPLVKVMGEVAKKVGGHGGMDFIMDYRMIYCLKNGLPMDMDVYDAAAWSAVTPLSYKSCANKSKSFDFPDFTRGRWKTNPALPVVTVDTKLLPLIDKLQSNTEQLKV